MSDHRRHDGRTNRNVLVTTAAILLTLPLVVFMVQQQQEIRQRASLAAFTTLPPGSQLPTDEECTTKVRRAAWEPRPENQPANLKNVYVEGYRLKDSELAKYGPDYESKVTGNFTGTTDEIVQWASCKWGFDENIIRAQIAVESSWHQSLLGTCRGGQVQPETNSCHSVGLMQIKAANIPPTHPGTWPYARLSTAFNLDYALASVRACYDGKDTALGAGSPAGDEYGCMAKWNTDTWYSEKAKQYITKVKQAQAGKVWNTYGAGAAPTVPVLSGTNPYLSAAPEEEPTATPTPYNMQAVSPTPTPYGKPTATPTPYGNPTPTSKPIGGVSTNNTPTPYVSPSPTPYVKATEAPTVTEYPQPTFYCLAAPCTEPVTPTEPYAPTTPTQTYITAAPEDPCSATSLAGKKDKKKDSDKKKKKSKHKEKKGEVSELSESFIKFFFELLFLLLTLLGLQPAPVPTPEPGPTPKPISPPKDKEDKDDDKDKDPVYPKPDEDEDDEEVEPTDSPEPGFEYPTPCPTNYPTDEEPEQKPTSYEPEPTSYNAPKATAAPYQSPTPTPYGNPTATPTPYGAPTTTPTPTPYNNPVATPTTYMAATAMPSYAPSEAVEPSVIEASPTGDPCETTFNLSSEDRPSKHKKHDGLISTAMKFVVDFLGNIVSMFTSPNPDSDAKLAVEGDANESEPTVNPCVTPSMYPPSPTVEPSQPAEPSVVVSPTQATAPTITPEPTEVPQPTVAPTEAISVSQIPSNTTSLQRSRR